MAKEFVVTDPIVLRVALDWRESGPSLAPLPSFRAVADVLAQFPRLKPRTVFVLYGRAHYLIHPHPANPEQGTQWTPKLSGGGILELVLARVDEPAQRVYLRYEVYPDQGTVPLQQPASWLVAEFNPTTILAGNNLLPATLAEPDTGEIDELPSSWPSFLITVYRLAFELLGQLAPAGRPDDRGTLQPPNLAGHPGRRRPRCPQSVGRLFVGRRPHLLADAPPAL